MSFAKLKVHYPEGGVSSGAVQISDPRLFAALRAISRPIRPDSPYTVEAHSASAAPPTTFLVIDTPADIPDNGWYRDLAAHLARQLSGIPAAAEAVPRTPITLARVRSLPSSSLTRHAQPRA